MNSTTLRAAAATWLRYEKQAPVVAFERGLEYYDNPDVLAIDKNRYLVEVEIKISVSDFRADRKKRKWSFRANRGPSQYTPRLFYYLVPPDMVDKVKAELQPGQGLLTTGAKSRRNGIEEIITVVSPRADKKAKRLEIVNVLRMVKHQSGTLCGFAAYEAKQCEIV